MWRSIRRLGWTFSSTAAGSTTSSTLTPLLQETKSIQGIFRPSSLKQKVESPLVVLVGWTRAKQKHVGKYAAVYESLGYPTLSLTPSLLHTLNVYSCEKYSRKIVKMLNDTYKGPFILHLFSGASTIVLPSFTQIAKNLEDLRLKGVVFDCGPGSFGKEAALAAGDAMLQGGMPKLSYYTAISTFFLADKVKGVKVREEADKALKQPVLSVPQLYLYSDIDPVLPTSKVERIMKEQKGLGRDVEGVLFKGATHVRLLQSEPDKYINRIAAFLRKIE